jgi:hypothetical protein
MKILKFKCELLSDVVLNHKSAADGNKKTLDFIPGNNFLGIVASALYPEKDERGDALTIFHSGAVMFGDAHPSTGGIRGLRMPASMFYPKQQKVTDCCFIHHLIPDLLSKEMKDLQLKQCRTGFCTCDRGKAFLLDVERSFAIKSAYNRNLRRSMDEMMYGYEALQKGSELYFEVCFTEAAEQYVENVKNALSGVKRVGRSRSAQYGLVKIVPWDYIQPVSVNKTVEVYERGEKVRCVTVYADGRLIFLDKYGLPTFIPSAEDLGVQGGKILWDKSQVRTFQYAPWNYKRKVYDTDRCGIEKGSVFVVEVSNVDFSFNTDHVGVYQNEGFGKVIYNPDFLDGDENGKAVYQVDKYNEEKKVLSEEIDKVEEEVKNIPLLEFLVNKKSEDDTRAAIYHEVNKFVDLYAVKFRNNAFASQWGTLRSIAMRYRCSDLQIKMCTYLESGIASEQWGEQGRRDDLYRFMKNVIQDKRIGIGELHHVIMNLASEMGKKCKRR